MSKDLYNWLEKEFYRCNIPKYHKYFKEWVSVITPDQIIGFEDQMIGMITQSKVKH